MEQEIQQQIFKNNKEYAAALENAAKTKKPAKTRADIMKRFHDVFSLAASTPVVNPNLSGNYAPIFTTEIIIDLCMMFGYEVLRESEQIVRRNWQKYAQDSAYKASVDKRQSMAKHCVMLRKPGNKHNEIARDIIIMNDYKGTMAFKCYIGNFGDMANLYKVTIHDIRHFISAKHTRDNKKTLESDIYQALERLGIMMTGKSTHKKVHNRNAKVWAEEREKQILQTKKLLSERSLRDMKDICLREMKMKKYPLNDHAMSMIENAAETWTSLQDMKHEFLSCSVNYAANWHAHASIGILDKRAKQASIICHIFNDVRGVV